MIRHDVLMIVTRQSAFEELQMAYFYILAHSCTVFSSSEFLKFLVTPSLPFSQGAPCLLVPVLSATGSCAGMPLCWQWLGSHKGHLAEGFL